MTPITMTMIMRGTFMGSIRCCYPLTISAWEFLSPNCQYKNLVKRTEPIKI